MKVNIIIVTFCRPRGNVERDGDGVLEGKEVRKKIKRKERIRKRRWKILLLKVKGRQWERLEWERLEWEREGRVGSKTWYAGITFAL